MKKIICVLILALSLGLNVWADSIWNKDSASPYSTEKNYKVGDIINVVILESTIASNKAGTKTDTSDTLAMKLTHTIQRLTPMIGQSNDIGASLGNKYSGSGQTSRTSSVQSRIAAWVTDVLPNGTLAIKGKHKMAVNDDLQEITITGIVRPKDISGNNTVFSYQVANAEVAISGTGMVAEAEAPGWISRIFNWLF